MAYEDSWAYPNYVGELLQIGQKATPFLNMIGGISNGGQISESFEFPMVQSWELGTGEQPAITETDSVAGVTETHFDRAQTKNTCQIFQKAINISYKKQSTMGNLSGLNLAGATNPVTSELDFQIMANLKQIAKNVDFTFLNGTQVFSSSATVAAKTGGISTLIPTENKVNAASADITRDMINAMLRQMADNGAAFDTPVLLCSMLQKQRISEIYGYAPADRNIGGVNINMIESDAGEFGIVWTPQLTASVVVLADIAFCSPVFCPVPGKGILFYEDKVKAGASEGGQIYGQIGLNIGDINNHGMIYGLTTV